MLFTITDISIFDNIRNKGGKTIIIEGVENRENYYCPSFLAKLVKCLYISF